MSTETSATPELTVSMPAYNTGKYIGQAIESVLRQENVDFELIVVDDGSNDDTVEVVKSFNDPRITLIQNDRNRGIPYCHNAVLDHSRAPFIAHVDSDDIVLAGAFEKLLAKIRSDPGIGQVHCYHMFVQADGQITSNDARLRLASLRKSRPPDMDYKRELLLQGSVMNHLRTYRRAVFDRVGRFNERLRCGEDLEMALRLVDKYSIRLVPEILYCGRIRPGCITKNLRFRALRFWWQRLHLVRRLVKERQIRFPREAKYRFERLLLASLLRILSRPFKRRVRESKRGIVRTVNSPK